MIRAFDYLRTLEPMRADVLAAVERVLTSGRLILGPETEAFEAEYAAFVGSRYCIGVSSGTNALHLALMAVGVGPGDEVIARRSQRSGPRCVREVGERACGFVSPALGDIEGGPHPAAGTDQFPRLVALVQRDVAGEQRPTEEAIDEGELAEGHAVFPEQPGLAATSALYARPSPALDTRGGGVVGQGYQEALYLLLNLR